MPVFGAMRADTLEFLLEQAELVNVAGGSFFFREGDPGDAMYVLERGEVQIIKSWDTQNLVLGTLASGACFGEMALIDLFPRSASIKSLSDCSAIQLTPDLLFEIYHRDLQQFTLLYMNVAREISRKLRIADQRLFELGMKSGLAREQSLIPAL